jgi:hypothetical protein
LTSRTVEEATCSGLVYLLGKQGADGRWFDFNVLPTPQSSDTLVTAYVGNSLIPALNATRYSGLKESLSRASNWLINNVNSDFGWGYNNNGPDSDADSTAQSLLFLTSLDEPVDARSFERLLNFQKEDGGFSKYIVQDGEKSWGDSQPEITPVALLALLSRLQLDHESIRRGTQYVLEHRGADGFWQSFWTDTYLYSTELNLKFLRKIGKPVDATSFEINKLVMKNSFELSLAGECLILVDYPQAKPLLEQLTSKLLLLQLPDGSWRESPIARLTSRTSHRPWAEPDNGSLYTDWNRVYTTATAVRFLAEYGIDQHLIESHLEEG